MVGAYIVLEGAARDTTVVVTDPAPLADEPVTLAARIAASAMAEPALRLEVARTLGTAGAVRTAAALAQADLVDARALTGPVQRERAQAALAGDTPDLGTFEEFGERWLGESIVAPLLEPLLLGRRVYRFARVLKGVSASLVAELQDSGGSSPLFQEQYPAAAERLKGGEVVTSDDHAAILRPGVSISSVELLERRPLVSQEK